MQRDRQRRLRLPRSGLRVVALHCLQRRSVTHAAGDPDLVVEHRPRHHQSGGRRIGQRPPFRGGLRLAWRQLQRLRRRGHLSVADTGRPADRVYRLVHPGDGHAVPRGGHVRQTGPRFRGKIRSPPRS